MFITQRESQCAWSLIGEEHREIRSERQGPEYVALCNPELGVWIVLKYDGKPLECFKQENYMT